MFALNCYACLTELCDQSTQTEATSLGFRSLRVHGSLEASRRGATRALKTRERDEGSVLCILLLWVSSQMVMRVLPESDIRSARSVVSDYVIVIFQAIHTVLVSASIEGASLLAVWIGHQVGVMMLL